MNPAALDAVAASDFEECSLAARVPVAAWGVDERIPVAWDVVATRAMERTAVKRDPVAAWGIEERIPVVLELVAEWGVTERVPVAWDASVAWAPVAWAPITALGVEDRDRETWDSVAA